jgi:hypothetical protein
MAIDLEWHDENAVILARYSGPPLGMAFVQQAEPSSSCLRFIDPYGDTTFNQRQIEALLMELGDLHTSDEALRSANTAVSAFLRLARARFTLT